MTALVQDPSVWVTELAVRPSIDDMLFVLRNFPVHVKILFTLTLLPVSMMLVTLISYLSKHVTQFFVAALGPLSWQLIVDGTAKLTTLIFNVLRTNHQTLIAPLLWVVLAVGLFWLRPSATRPPPAPNGHDASPRRQRRLQQRFARNQRRRSLSPPKRSIRTEGFHRQYPINLRAMGQFIRRPPPRRNNTQRFVPNVHDMHELRHELDVLQNQVFQLTETVRVLQELPPDVHPTFSQHQVWARQQPLPNVTREGEERHRIQVMERHRGQTSPDQPSPNRFSRARRAPNRPHPPATLPAALPPPNVAYPSPVQSNTPRAARRANAARRIMDHLNMAEVNMTASGPSMRAVLQAPSRFRSTLKADSTFAVIWDSGASVTITPNKDDFDGPILKPSTITQLKGIAKGLRIEGQGHVKWSFHDIFGNLRTLTLPAYYVPKVRVRLLSTTSLLQQYNGESIKVEAHQLTLSGIPGDPTRAMVVAHVNPDNNLPTSEAHRQVDIPKAAECLNATITAVNESNLNLSEPEKELLRWHYRLGHMSFKKIQFLLRTGVLTRSNNKRHLHQAACKLDQMPKCAACQYGKQHRRPAPGRTTSIIRDRVGVLKDAHLIPGQQVSIDHFICSTKGRLFTSAGKTVDNEMYTGGCIFNDHASGYIHVEFQTHLTTHETLMAKENFELMCRDHGVIPQSYLSDNGKCFTSKEFSEKLTLFEQIIRFAGVGAHHHNGNAERSIRTIMSIARTMMLHSAIHWPDVADATIWPMAVAHAVYLHNHMPNMETGLAPVDVFTKSRWQQHKFHDLHVWGCPVYVLDKSMADGKKLPRWQPRSIRSVNMGLSDKHASTVPLVLNVASGYITPQFHVVFDDWFTTVTSTIENLPNFNSDEWAKLFGESSYQYPFDDEDERLIVESAASDLPTQQTVDHINGVVAAMDTTHVVQQLPASPPPTTTFPITPFPDQATMSSPPIPLSTPVPMSSTRETTTMTTPKVDSTDTRRHIDSMSPATLFPSPPLQTPRPPTPAPTPSPPSKHVDADAFNEGALNCSILTSPTCLCSACSSSGSTTTRSSPTPNSATTSLYSSAHRANASWVRRSTRPRLRHRTWCLALP